jgi:hypothetical protein
MYSSSSAFSMRLMGFSKRFCTGLRKRNELWRNSAGQLPKTSTNLSTSKYSGLVQTLSKPSRVAKSMPAARSIRFLTRFWCGNTPLDQVGVEAALDEVVDHASAGFEVQNVRPVHQGEDKHERRGVTGRLFGRVMKKLEPVFLVNDFGGGDAFFNALRLLVGADVRPTAGESGSHPLPEALGHSLHQMESEMGCLLDEEVEPLFINRRELAVRFGHSGRAARQGIDQRHLPQKIVHPNCLDHFAMNINIHFSFENDKHFIGGISVLENGVTRLERDEELGVPEEMAELHGGEYADWRQKFKANILDKPALIRFLARCQISVGRASAQGRMGLGRSGVTANNPAWRHKNRDLRCPGIHAQKAKVRAITSRETQHTCNTFSASIHSMSLNPTKE